MFVAIKEFQLLNLVCSMDWIAEYIREEVVVVLALSFSTFFTQMVFEVSVLFRHCSHNYYHFLLSTRPLTLTLPIADHSHADNPEVSILGRDREQHLVHGCWY